MRRARPPPAPLSPGAPQAEFEADLSQIPPVGPNPVTLEVRLVDSLGLESSAQTSVVVENAPPPLRSSVIALTAFSVLGLVCVAVVVVIALGGGVYFLRRRAPQRAAPAP